MFKEVYQQESILVLDYIRQKCGLSFRVDRSTVRILPVKKNVSVVPRIPSSHVAVNATRDKNTGVPYHTSERLVLSQLGSYKKKRKKLCPQSGIIHLPACL